MLAPRALAVAAVLASPAVAGARGPSDPETGPVQLELHGPDGTALADRVAQLRCLGGPAVPLRTDDAGRITLERRETTGCTVIVEHEGIILSRALGPALGDRETITLTAARLPSPAPVGRTISMEEFRNIPVGSSTSRDFTAALESSETAPRDSAGITLVGTSSPGEAPPSDPGFSPGTLTAGAVDDVASRESFGTLLRELGTVSPAFDGMEQPRHVVQVLDGRGRPVAGAQVSVGNRTLRTRRDGRVVLLPGWDQLTDRSPLRVRTQGVTTTATLRLSPRGSQRVRVRSLHVDPPAPRVDLALVLDTTGSMADELHYLQVELGSLLSRLDADHEALDIRWSLVAYRDEGDEYVVRVYDFTDDFSGFSTALARQVATGGGDTPEAVHTALAHAEQLAWRDAAVATRVLLHVADARPHAEHVAAALRAADRLRAAGTAIYPVAASGVDSLAELSMRAMAMASGGQYVFLTDDSGLGLSHREATASCFSVEPLIEVLGRILEAELDGRRPRLPKGNRGDACPQPRPLAQAPAPHGWSRHHPLERSLFDDDAASELLHQPRTFHLAP